MMKRYLYLAALCAAIPWGASAQVEKQVEVTKAYIPRVESATKLAIEPDMTDTVTMRPEIDYTITPLSMQRPLATTPIQPARVTFWEFNRPRPFYLKAGAGYPFNTLLDAAYAKDFLTGYLAVMLNHEGSYSDRHNLFGIKNSAMQMTNRLSVAAGHRLGNHTVEGNLVGNLDAFDRYGLLAGSDPDHAPDDQASFGDVGLKLRIGDDFKDLSRLNFEVALRGLLFSDLSDRPEAWSQARQHEIGASAKIARAMGRNSRFALDVAWERIKGAGALDGNDEQILRAGLRYGLDGERMKMEVGADYYYDRIELGLDPDPTKESNSYLIPFARMKFNLGRKGLRPFVELDGALLPSDYRSLARINPYFTYTPRALTRSEVNYNGRLGIDGSLFGSRFTYRAYVGFSIRDNHRYWYSEGVATPEVAECVGGAIRAQMGRQTVTSLNAELLYRPITPLYLSLALHGYVYNNESRIYAFSERSISLDSGAPDFEGIAAIRYEGRKIGFSVEALLQGERNWSAFTHTTNEAGEPAVKTGCFTAPLGVDLRVAFDWRVSSLWGLFVEGRNLADRTLYRYAWYPELGANFRLGVKATF